MADPRELAEKHPDLLTRACECGGFALFTYDNGGLFTSAKCLLCHGIGRRLLTLEEAWDAILERTGPTYVGFHPLVQPGPDKQAERVIGWRGEVNPPLGHQVWPACPIHRRLHVHSPTRREAAFRLLIEVTNG